MHKLLPNATIGLITLLLLTSCISPPKVEVIATELQVPWAISFFNDGSFLFTERNTGNVYHYQQNVKQIAKINTRPIGEGGLMGIAIDPESENHVYIYYTYGNGLEVKNRVSRFTYNGELKDEEIIIDEIPGSVIHDGGRIEFGPDGKLYITTGDANQPMLSQDLDSLAGKILRINKNGSVPEDNPFGTMIYSYGHRNSQGLAWHNGQLYAPEHGPSRNDEINIIQSGQNYGWPIVQCTDHQQYAAPIKCFSDWTLAPGGATFDEQGNLYVAGLRGEQIRKFTIQNGQITNEETFIEGIGRLREVKYNNGYIYITTSNMDGRGFPQLGDDKIFKVKIQ